MIKSVQENFYHIHIPIKDIILRLQRFLSCVTSSVCEDVRVAYFCIECTDNANGLDECVGLEWAFGLLLFDFIIKAPFATQARPVPGIKQTN